MFWCVTVPSPMFGSHIDGARRGAGSGRGRGTAWCRRRPCPGAVSRTGRRRATRGPHSPPPATSAASHGSSTVARRDVLGGRRGHERGGAAARPARAPRACLAPWLPTCSGGRARVRASTCRARRSSSETIRSIALRERRRASSASRPVSPSTMASSWPGDARGDRRRTAGGGLGDASSPSRPWRRPRERPRPAVEVDLLRLVDVAGQADPALGAGFADLASSASRQ